MISKEEAKTKICPVMRFQSGYSSDYHTCMTDKCMAWREKRTVTCVRSGNNCVDLPDHILEAHPESYKAVTVYECLMMPGS